MADTISKALAQQWRTQRWNPLRTVTPQSAGFALDQFDAGHLRQAALMWEQIEDRDDVAVTVCEKRRAKVAACRWDVLIGEEVPDAQRAEAERQQQALKEFYSRLAVRSAVDLDVEGGVKLMIERIMDARLVKYSQFEIAWSGGLRGRRAELWHVPAYFMEATTGRLRFAGVHGTAPGREIDRQAWLIAVGKPLMKAVTVCYMFKRLSLADWLNLSEKFGIPGVHYETSAQRGSAEWDKAADAAARFASEFVMVTSAGEKLNLVTVSQTGDGPFAPMVERMDRAMARVVLGADLSTLSRAEGAGASLQGSETDDLTAGDCEWISELVQRQLDRQVLEWTFGRNVEPLAFFKLTPPASADTRLEMAVDNHVKTLGVRLSPQDVAERYGRTHDEGEPEEDAPLEHLNDEDDFDDEPPAAGNARGGPRPGKPAGKMPGARKPFDESKHRRGEGGQFANKPAAFDPDQANQWAPSKQELAEKLRAGRQAMERCITRREDQLGAIDRPGIGPVDFIWGTAGQPPLFKGGRGIAKIIAKRDYEAATNPKLQGQSGVNVARAMVQTLLLGQVGKPYPYHGEPDQRVNVGWKNFTAALDRGPVREQPDRNQHWLLSGFINLADES